MIEVLAGQLLVLLVILSVMVVATARLLFGKRVSVWWLTVWLWCKMSCLIRWTSKRLARQMDQLGDSLLKAKTGSLVLRLILLLLAGVVKGVGLIALMPSVLFGRGR